LQADIDLCQLPPERKKILAYLQKVAFCSWQGSLKIHGCSCPSEIGKLRVVPRVSKSKSSKFRSPCRAYVVEGDTGFTTEQAGIGPRAAGQTPASRAEPEPGAGRGAVEGAVARFMAEMLLFTVGLCSQGEGNTYFQHYALNRFFLNVLYIHVTAK